MKKMILKGACQTLILLTALFLISVWINALPYQDLSSNPGSMDDIAAVIQEELRKLPDNQRSEPGTAIPETKEAPDDPSAAPFRVRVVSWIADDPGALQLTFAGLFLLIALALIPDLFPWGGICRKKQDQDPGQGRRLPALRHPVPVYQ